MQCLDGSSWCFHCIWLQVSTCFPRKYVRNEINLQLMSNNRHCNLICFSEWKKPTINQWSQQKTCVGIGNNEQLGCKNIFGTKLHRSCYSPKTLGFKGAHTWWCFSASVVEARTRTWVKRAEEHQELQLCCNFLPPSCLWLSELLAPLSSQQQLPGISCISLTATLWMFSLHPFQNLELEQNWFMARTSLSLWP